MITDNQRNKAFNALPDHIQSIYSSLLAMKLSKDMKLKYKIPESKFDAYLDATGDVILGFYRVADLPRLLQNRVGMDETTANKLTSELIEHFGPVIEREQQETEAKKSDLSVLAHKIAAIQPTVTFETPAVAPDPAPQSEETVSVAPTIATQPVIEPVKPLRTMSSDAEKIHGYGSLPQYQEHDEDETIVKAIPQDELRQKN